MKARDCEHNEGYCRDKDCEDCDKKENLRRKLSNDDSWLRTLIKDFRPYRNKTSLGGLR